ncbi:MAG: hydrolase [Saprospiraceae bacterium]|nr:MAG: nicotinamidase [Candidatus Parvibacillus calidus]MBK7740764.1 hydrolase [Candidatus Parvibacillus calidus]WKZ64707.1 MAG: hydrolase [Saprospiraceae bacterium]
MNKINSVFPTISETMLMVIDVQERLMPVIHDSHRVTHNINTLIRGAAILGVDTLITEQYPKGLGNTIEEIDRSSNPPIFEKDCFSCMLQPNVSDFLFTKQKKHLVLCGVESHICVLKTALDAESRGYTVHLVADAVSSRTPENKDLAIGRMRQSGIYIVSVEMILFMLMERAGTDQFKAISKLIK